MSFLSPIGLLGLIGIPILILIYIIKSKYQERVIASTYIWELSEKFLTKKSPITKLSGLLSLILQILTVLFLSLALAHPIISIPNAAKNYVMIIDTSASMNMSNRFDTAKNEMIKVVDEAKNDSTFTIITSGNSTSKLCENITNKEKVIQTINSIKLTTLSSNNDEAIALAQEIFNEDSSSLVYLFTDEHYLSSENIEVVNVSNEEYNASINSLYYKQTDEKLTFMGDVTSYTKDENLSLQLFLDDKLISETEVSCIKDTAKEYSFEIDVYDFEKAMVKIVTEDDLVLDNEYILYGNESIDNYKILLVSDEPFYLKSILNVFSTATINAISTSTYMNQTGYDLYVFDGYSPTSLPEDGSIWLFNVKQNIANSGFTSQESINITDGAKLKVASSNDEVFKTLSQNLFGNEIIVSKYQSYSLISSYTILMYYQNHPMIFAGVNSNGNRQIVFSFDLHDSNLPLLLDYIILFNNMIKYSLPSLCEQTSFYCGDELVLNNVPNLQNIRINTPSGYSTYLTVEDGYAKYKLSEIGTYEIKATINGIIKTYKIFVAFPLTEQNPVSTIEKVELIGEKNNIAFDSTYDIQWILFIVVLFICLAEWGLYLYEQRKVR